MSAVNISGINAADVGLSSQQTAQIGRGNATLHQDGQVMANPDGSASVAFKPNAHETERLLDKHAEDLAKYDRRRKMRMRASAPRVAMMKERGQALANDRAQKVSPAARRRRDRGYYANALRAVTPGPRTVTVGRNAVQATIGKKVEGMVLGAAKGVVKAAVFGMTHGMSASAPAMPARRHKFPTPTMG